jgi:hypothetical protein
LLKKMQGIKRKIVRYNLYFVKLLVIIIKEKNEGLNF